MGILQAGPFVWVEGGVTFQDRAAICPPFAGIPIGEASVHDDVVEAVSPCAVLDRQGITEAWSNRSKLKKEKYSGAISVTRKCLTPC
jgi:hypothetical protein